MDRCQKFSSAEPARKCSGDGRQGRESAGLVCCFSFRLYFAMQCWSGRSARAAGAMGNPISRHIRVRSSAKLRDLEKQSTAWKDDEVPHVWGALIRICKFKRLHVLHVSMQPEEMGGTCP